MLSLWKQGAKVKTLSTQYGIPCSTIYYWIARYKAHRTYQRVKSITRRITRKVTDAVKAAVLKKHKEYPLLGCYRLALFEYEHITLSHTTIWRILLEAKPPFLPPQILYVLLRYHQIWFLDHMHIRTLPNGQKIYSLIVIDGLSRVLLSDEVILSKSARDVCFVLLRTFALHGLPEEIVSDNAKAFISFLYTLLLGRLSVKVKHITPGCPWENPYADSVIGTLRAYLYPHSQRQKRVESVGHLYSNTVNYYNQRTHWEFRKDAVKMPQGKLAGTKGRDMPEEFTVDFIATGKRSIRTVDGQGRISIRRYRLYVNVSLSKQKVEIREFVTSLVVVYKSGAVVTYRYTETQEAEQQPLEIQNSPVFHHNRTIKKSPQLELFDETAFSSPLRYVIKRLKKPETQTDTTRRYPIVHRRNQCLNKRTFSDIIRPRKHLVYSTPSVEKSSITEFIRHTKRGN